jgi:hypothetical protein
MVLVLIGLGGCSGTLGSLLSVVSKGEVHARLTVERGVPAGVPVVVYLEPLERPAARGHFRGAGILQPRQGALLPAFLVVTQGQRIQFSGDDGIVHRFFSYDKANAFELGMHRGNATSVRLERTRGSVPPSSWRPRPGSQWGSCPTPTRSRMFPQAATA